MFRHIPAKILVGEGGRKMTYYKLLQDGSVSEPIFYVHTDVLHSSVDYYKSLRMSFRLSRLSLNWETSSTLSAYEAADLR